MSVTSGFFNSLSGDRKYGAIQISSMFDGLMAFIMGFWSRLW